MEVEKALMGRKWRQRAWVCCLNAWIHYVCSITPSVTFCFIYQTDSETRLAMRHVGLCTLQRWTNRADRSVMHGYQGACVLSKHCCIRSQNSSWLLLVNSIQSLKLMSITHSLVALFFFCIVSPHIEVSLSSKLKKCQLLQSMNPRSGYWAE